MAEETKNNIAKQYVIQHLKHFISSKCYAHYKLYLGRVSSMWPLTLDGCIAEIQRIESSGVEYEITTEKRMPKEATLWDITSGPQTAGIHAISAKTSDKKKGSSKDQRRSRSKSNSRNSKQDRGRSYSRSASSTPFSSRNSSRAATPVNNIEADGDDSHEVHYVNQRSNSGNRSNHSSNGQTQQRGRSQERRQSGGNTQQQRPSSSTSNGTGLTCYRCGHVGHIGKNCFRFASGSAKACRNCESMGLRLYHDQFYCPNSSKTRYRSPSANTRNETIRSIEERNKRREEYRKGNSGAR